MNSPERGRVATSSKTTSAGKRTERQRASFLGDLVRVRTGGQRRTSARGGGAKDTYPFRIRPRYETRNNLNFQFAPVGRSKPRKPGTAVLECYVVLDERFCPRSSHVLRTKAKPQLAAD